jgi:hypothetical protein
MIENDESFEQSILIDRNSHLSENKKNDYEINNKIIEEQICCIELTNNNYIYIKYEDKWTIRDVRI